MKTMQDYTCYCTEEQTRRAYKLGAPMEVSSATRDFNLEENGLALLRINQKDNHYRDVLTIPTTQQMIRWLEAEKSFGFSRNVGKYIVRYSVFCFGDSEEDFDTNIITTTCSTEHAAIDAALNYLEKELCKTDFNEFKKHIKILEKIE